MNENCRGFWEEELGVPSDRWSGTWFADVEKLLLSAESQKKQTAKSVHTQPKRRKTSKDGESAVKVLPVNPEPDLETKR